jgi:hypothetical protein
LGGFGEPVGWRLGAWVGKGNYRDSDFVRMTRC